jgi:hypothetical protein
MRNRFYLLILFFSFVFSVNAQHVYTVSGGEIIFQSARVEQNGNDINTNLRFTVFFHAGEYLHLDMGDHIGMFSGIGIRNVGLITEENHIKTKYRTYNLGVPLAIKAGSFKKNAFIFAGAEYELMMQYKQKTFEGGSKTKYTSWFSARTPHFIPSAFAGIQFPVGVQIKFRYYLENYLNESYAGINKSQVWYISLSYQIRNNRIKNYKPISTDMACN